MIYAPLFSGVELNTAGPLVRALLRDMLITTIWKQPIFYELVY
jgi:hypothetical protein